LRAEPDNNQGGVMKNNKKWGEEQLLSGLELTVL
jgi:hypothetical protein